LALIGNAGTWTNEPGTQTRIAGTGSVMTRSTRRAKRFQNLFVGLNPPYSPYRRRVGSQ
jgi:hypothetical protein